MSRLRLAAFFAVETIAVAACRDRGEPPGDFQPASQQRIAPLAPPMAAPPPRWPVCPSVWSVVGAPGDHAGVLFTLRGFVLVEFEYAEVFATFQELETRLWQQHAGVRVPRRQLLLLEFEGQAGDGLDAHTGREVDLTGRIEPVLPTEDKSHMWDAGVKFVVQSFSPVVRASGP